MHRRFRTKTMVIVRRLWSNEHESWTIDLKNNTKYSSVCVMWCHVTSMSSSQTTCPSYREEKKTIEWKKMVFWQTFVAFFYCSKSVRIEKREKIVDFEVGISATHQGTEL